MTVTVEKSQAIGSVETIATQIGVLGPQHAGQVHDLHQYVLAKTPTGFLTPRSRLEIETILGSQADNASVGAWSDGRLVAYSLCALALEPPYQASPLLRLAAQKGDPVWTGRGTVVDPAFEGRMLMARLLKRREELIAASACPRHCVGLIATDNHASLLSAMRTNSWLIGLERDEYCLNFVCYGGVFADEIPLGESSRLALSDLDGLAQSLAQGWVGTGVDKDPATGERFVQLRRLLQAEEERA